MIWHYYCIAYESNKPLKEGGIHQSLQESTESSQQTEGQIDQAVYYEEAAREYRLQQIHQIACAEHILLEWKDIPQVRGPLCARTSEQSLSAHQNLHFYHPL